MKNKYLVVVVIILSIIAIISSHNKKATYFNDENIYITVKDDTNDIISNIDL